jgi:large subunit ribosomal protein L21
MYAVVKTGGKQYRVSEGDTIQVEKLDGAPGDKVVLDQVLLLRKDEALRLGTPMVVGARVEAEILDQGKGPKIIVYRYKRRKMYRKKTGHRQPLTSLRVTGIQG